VSFGEDVLAEERMEHEPHMAVNAGASTWPCVNDSRRWLGCIGAEACGMWREDRRLPLGCILMTPPRRSGHATSAILAGEQPNQNAKERILK